MTEALDEIGQVLKEKGVTTEELLEKGREKREEVINKEYGLSDNLRRRVLDFVQKLKLLQSRECPEASYFNLRGRSLKRTWMPMQKAIDEECEKIDLNEW